MKMSTQSICSCDGTVDMAHSKCVAERRVGSSPTGSTIPTIVREVDVAKALRVGRLRGLLPASAIKETPDGK